MGIFKKKIIIATHMLVYGAPQALRDFLIGNEINKLLYISHPLFVDSARSYYELIINGRILKLNKSLLRFPIAVLNYPLELFVTFYWVLKNKDKYDIFIGVDNLNAFAGIILKHLGMVKKVIYYTIDFVPTRFKNKYLNSIYHWFDSFAVIHSDEVWDVSPRIMEGRKKLLKIKDLQSINSKVVPIGIWFDKVKRSSFAKIKHHQLFFVGHLMESSGVQLVIEGIPTIIKKIPDFHFLIVGGGEYEINLKTLTQKLGVGKYVTFTGWIKERKKLDTIMADSALAVALYNKQTSRNTYYADPTKLKDYLSAGLPIILTDLPHNAKDIEKNNCGLIVPYDKNKISNAIVTLLNDENKLKEFRTNAMSYVKNFDWNRIFTKHLQ